MIKAILGTFAFTLLLFFAGGAFAYQSAMSHLPENFNSFSEIKSGYEQFKSLTTSAPEISPEVIDLAKDPEFVDIAERFANDEQFRADVEDLQAAQN